MNKQKEQRFIFGYIFFVYFGIYRLQEVDPSVVLNCSPNRNFFVNSKHLIVFL
jgi:hypothetical protein